MAERLNFLFSQDVSDGVLPTQHPAFDPEADSGDYFGSSRFFEFLGAPVSVIANAGWQNPGVAQRTRDASEEVAGVAFAA